MILITGSTGYIGSHLSLYFQKKKIEFIGIDNLSYSYKSNINKKGNHFFFDISSKKKVFQLIKKYNIDTVIHAAAFSYVLEAEEKKKKYFLNNITKTKKFIDICKKAKIKRFIFFSSSNVYKEKKGMLKINEKDLTNPKNFYGQNKLLIEQYLKKTKFDSLVILRLFNIIGIFNPKFKIFNFKKKNYQRLIFKIIQNIKNKKITNINFMKINNQRKFPSRDFISINSLSLIIFKLIIIIKSNKKINKTFNIGSGIATDINKITYKIKKKFKSRVKFKYLPISKKELNYTKACINNIIKYLRYKPKFNLNKTLRTHYE